MSGFLGDSFAPRCGELLCPRFPALEPTFASDYRPWTLGRWRGIRRRLTGRNVPNEFGELHGVAGPLRMLEHGQSHHRCREPSSPLRFQTETLPTGELGIVFPSRFCIIGVLPTKTVKEDDGRRSALGQRQSAARSLDRISLSCARAAGLSRTATAPSFLAFAAASPTAWPLMTTTGRSG